MHPPSLRPSAKSWLGMPPRRQRAVEKTACRCNLKCTKFQTRRPGPEGSRPGLTRRFFGPPRPGNENRLGPENFACPDGPEIPGWAGPGRWAAGPHGPGRVPLIQPSIRSGKRLCRRRLGCCSVGQPAKTKNPPRPARQEKTPPRPAPGGPPDRMGQGGLPAGCGAGCLAQPWAVDVGSVLVGIPPDSPFPIVSGEGICLSTYFQAVCPHKVVHLVDPEDYVKMSNKCRANVRQAFGVLCDAHAEDISGIPLSQSGTKVPGTGRAGPPDLDFRATLAGPTSDWFRHLMSKWVIEMPKPNLT